MLHFLLPYVQVYVGIQAILQLRSNSERIHAMAIINSQVTFVANVCVHVCVCKHPNNFTVSNSELIHAINRHTLLQYTYLVQRLTSPFLLVLTEFTEIPFTLVGFDAVHFNTERNYDILINFRLDVGRGKICYVLCFV